MLAEGRAICPQVRQAGLSGNGESDVKHGREPAPKAAGSPIRG